MRPASETPPASPPLGRGGVTPVLGVGSEGTPPVQFGSWDGAVELRSAKLLDRLASDCSAVFSARAAASASSSDDGEGGGYSAGSTYWISRGGRPRCLLEQIALAILESHLPPETSVSPPSPGTEEEGSGKVGAEWWALFIDAEDDAVGFHWDLDYDAEERLGVHRTPYAGTVTYLCDAGAPTLFFDKAPTPASRDGPPEDGRPIARGWISCPAPGKHVLFRGSWLHGAPDLGEVFAAMDSKICPGSVEEEPAVSRRGRGGGGGGASKRRGKGSSSSSATKVRGNKRPKRVSLLVNVWLDGAPGLAAPLPKEVAARLSPCLAKVPFSLSLPSPLSKQAITHAPPGDKRGGESRARAAKRIGRQEFSWPVANLAEGVVCSVCVQMPKSIDMVIGGTSELTFRPGEAVLLF